MKKVFLSGTYIGQEDLIEEITSMLKGQKIDVIHFQGGVFPSGIVGHHPHDICLKNVKDTPNYLLIVGSRAGSIYEGENVSYHGLTVTHAEFKTACEASGRSTARSAFFFVRQKIVDSYDIWKTIPEKERNKGSWPAEPEVYILLQDMDQKNIYRLPYRDLAHLRELILDSLPKFVEFTDEIINLDTLSSYIQTKFPERPPTPKDVLFIVTLELGRYACLTLSELDGFLKKADKAFVELDKEMEDKGIKGIHGGGVIRNSLWILDEGYYEKRVAGFSAEKDIDRGQFRRFIE